MDNTYLKSQGTAKTYFEGEGERHENQTSWEIDYDGKEADIHLDIKTDGEKGSVNVKLDNEDLAELLQTPSVKIP